MKVWKTEHQLCIDIVNPYIKLLGITDIMSDSEKKTPTVSPDPGATGETATSDGDGKGKCARYSSDWLECKSKEVKELPCKHYCHSLCVVLFYEIEWEEACCLVCRSRIPSDWLKKTVEEIRDQPLDERDEIKCLVLNIMLSR